MIELWDEKNSTERTTNYDFSGGTDNVSSTSIIETDYEKKACPVITIEKPIRATIYKITNKITGGKYVGQTIQPLKIRWLDHQQNAYKRKYKCPLYSAIRKYGSESFIVGELLTDNFVDKSSAKTWLNIQEPIYIKSECTFIGDNKEFGYNLTTGGNCAIFSDGSRLKMSKSQTRLWDGARRKQQSERSFGYWQTESYRKTHKTAMDKVKDDPNFLKKMSDVSKQVWKTDGYKEKMSAIRKELYKNNQSVRDRLVRNGKANGRYDPTVYCFKNDKTDVIFSGTQYEFTHHFSYPKTGVNGLIRGRCEKYHGWVINK